MWCSMSSARPLVRCQYPDANRRRTVRCRYAMAGGLGFEPRFSESESDVLPLNYPPPRGRSCYSKLGSLCKLQEGIDDSANFRAPGRARETFPPRAGALAGGRRSKIILPGPERHELRPTCAPRYSPFRRSEVPFHDHSEEHTAPRMPATQVSSTSRPTGSSATMSAR
jgi:hypothetical protein